MKVINFFLYPIVTCFLKYKLYRFLYKQNKSQKILVLDIDNTIADTWPNLALYKKDRRSFYLNLPLLKNSINYIKSKYSKLPIIFLSNRNFINYNLTHKWLIKNNFDTKEFILILTQKPDDKISFLNIILNSFSVIYFDDLSYNHENGKVLFYNDVIKKVRKLDLIYYDYNFIKKINE
tara:strand:- start:10383 stop:10916 length:534 start_codon:yes stop_codon:yes gene_type:complete